jgi:predicted transcriptional regulator
MRTYLNLILLCFVSSSGLAEVKVGHVPPVFDLNGKDGETVDGSQFSTSQIRGKVYSFFYVDPDQKEDNERLELALKAASLDKETYGSIAVINLAATWKPNFIIESVLSSKQKEFPNTTYVKDKTQFFVKNWGLKDNAYHVLLFDKNGKCLFNKAGTLTEEEIQGYVGLIKEHSIL